MKKVLLITIGFPPEGGGGTIRAAKLAKYLPQFDWETLVLTACPPKPLKDKQTLHIKVYRAPRCDIARLFVDLKQYMKDFLGGSKVKVRTDLPEKGLEKLKHVALKPRRRLSEYIFIPDDRIFWMPGAFFLGFFAILKEKPDLIYSTSPSPATLLLGYCLNCLTGLPWIIEFRDPWLFNPFRTPRPMKWMESVESWMESIVLHKAEHIVVTSQQYKLDFIKHYPKLPPDKFTYVPNGYDPEDFVGVYPCKFDQFTIVHTGNFYAERSSLPFLAGLDIFLIRHPDARPNMQVLLVGQEDLNTKTILKSLNLEDVVRQVGVVSHTKSIEFMLGADLLLLIPGPGNGTMPGKTFEYLAAQKPIFALADNGVVHDFITTTGIGLVVKPDDYEVIATSISVLYDQILSNNYTYHDTKEVRSYFDRRQIACKTAQILQKVSN